MYGRSTLPKLISFARGTSAAGMGTSDAQHWADPVSVREEVPAAGSVLNEENTAPAQQDGPRSHRVFDPSINTTVS